MGHGGAYVHSVAPEVAARRRAVVDLPWTWLRQVHGDGVVRVAAPGEGAGTKADASVTTAAGSVLAILVADCAPVALASPEGVIGAAHAGWNGVLAGVLQRTVKEMRALGATDVHALIGPCIGPECYEFGVEHLRRFSDRFGPAVVARTAAGTPALDLRQAVRGALAEQGVDDVGDVGVCTACSRHHYSWRARRERERQAVLLWK